MIYNRHLCALAFNCLIYDIASDMFAHHNLKGILRMFIEPSTLIFIHCSVIKNILQTLTRFYINHDSIMNEIHMMVIASGQHSLKPQHFVCCTMHQNHQINCLMYAMDTFHVNLTFEANKRSTMITNVLSMPLGFSMKWSHINHHFVVQYFLNIPYLRGSFGKK